jgi:hypothetical protein
VRVGVGDGPGVEVPVAVGLLVGAAVKVGVAVKGGVTTSGLDVAMCV